MSIWLLMIIPVTASIGMLWLLRKKFIWWEYVSIFAISAVFILISKLIITSSMTSDTEYWSERGVKVKYEGAYDEWIVDECSYDCFCSTDDDGWESCQTCWEDCSYMKHHEDYYTLITESGNSQSISRSNYNSIAKKWGGQNKVGNHPEHETYDNGIYEAYLPKDKPNLVECVVTSHSYENKVAVSHAEYEFLDIKVTEEDVNKYGLYEYPKVSGYSQEHILGPGDETKPKAVRTMNLLNAELGPKKQLKAFIIVFKGYSEESGKMQEAYWKGGNKNEFVMTIGVDDKNNVQWAYPFTWCENELLKTTTTNRVMQQEKLNLADISQYMYGELDANFERKHFSDFSQLKAEPTKKSLTISMIVLFLIVIGFVIGFAMNNHDAKEREGGIFKRFSKDNFDY